jgi:hypothetical protein
MLSYKYPLSKTNPWVKEPGGWGYLATILYGISLGSFSGISAGFEKHDNKRKKRQKEKRDIFISSPK